MIFNKNDISGLEYHPVSPAGTMVHLLSSQGGPFRDYLPSENHWIMEYSGQRKRKIIYVLCAKLMVFWTEPLK